MDNNFADTRVGRKFLEYTMPELTHQLTKLNGHLEKLIAFSISYDGSWEEPFKSTGDINKEIKDGIENIVNFRKD